MESQLQAQKKEARIGIQDLFKIGTVLISVGVIFAIGADILASSRDDAATCPTGYNYNTTANWCANTTNTSNADGFRKPINEEWNATTNAMDGVFKIPAKMPIIGTVLIVSVVIGLITSFLIFRSRR